MDHHVAETEVGYSDLCELLEKEGIENTLKYDRVCSGEKEVADALIRKGFDIGRGFRDGERDSFGPLSRVIKINGEWYFYG